MLRLKQIHIKNFRSIREETFFLPDLSILIGKNDVGKSNILEALKILFEGTANDVNQENFYDPSMPIEILAHLEGVSGYLELCDEKNRTKIRDRIDEDGLLVIRRIAHAPRNLSKIEIFDASDGEFNTPTGIDAAFKVLLPEVIFIEALADVSDETRGTQKDALGKLMGQVLGGISQAVGPSLRLAYETADGLLNVRTILRDGQLEDSDQRVGELRDIESELTAYLQETFPAAAIRLRVGLPTVEDILGNVQVFVREGPQLDPFHRRGHGLQRALYLSLLRALAARIRRGQRTGVTRPFMLLFEEPEAFLHPEAQIKLRNALGAIATRAQVIMATHSPLLVTPNSVNCTIRVEKKSDTTFPRPYTKGWGPIQLERLEVGERQLLQFFAVQRSSRFLFCRGVLLVEGTGDEHLICAVARRLRQFNFEDAEVAVVEAGGKDAIAPFMSILKKLGLVVWGLVDVDFLWSGAGQLLGADPVLSRFSARLHEIVPPSEGGQPNEAQRREEKRNRIEACRNDLSPDRNELCERLTAHGIFVLREGEIEDYVGLGQTAKSQYLQAATEIDSGRRPISFPEDIVRVVDAIRAWQVI